MAEFVLDNSVVMRWIHTDQATNYSGKVLESLADGMAFVPAVWPLEIGNSLVKAIRRKLLEEATATRFLALLDSLPIQVEPESPDRMLKEIYSLALRHGLSTYDASYLDLTMRKAIPLATQDDALARAAKDCRVPLYKP